jgi:heat shock protein HslJ
MRYLAHSLFALLATSVLLTSLAAAVAADEPKLTGEWKLVKLGDDDVKAAEPPTLSVTEEGKVSGFAGVNRFFGGRAKEKTLFGPLAMTRKAGPPELNKLEVAYTAALAEVTRFTIDKDKLTLLTEDKPRLVFERIPKEK